jgi:TPR repeat protein
MHKKTLTSIALAITLNFSTGFLLRNSWAESDNLSYENLSIGQILIKVKSNDERAIFELAHRYEIGLNVNQNLNESNRLYLKSAELGYGEAQFRMGEYYMQRGEYKNAMQWFLKASNSQTPSNASAANRIGEIYSNGLGVSKDLSKAKEWYLKSVEIGGINGGWGLLNLGGLYENGLGVQTNLETALDYYKKAQDQKFKKAIIDKAILSHNSLKASPKFSSLMNEVFQRVIADELAEYKKKEAQRKEQTLLKYQEVLNKNENNPTELAIKAIEYGLGLEGVDVDIDLLEALLARESASKNDPLGLALFGIISKWNPNKETSLPESVTDEYLKKSFAGLKQLADTTQTPYVKAILSMLYQYGYGVEQSYEKALDYLNKSANEKKDSLTYYRLYNLYINGIGVEKDKAKAIRYLENGLSINQNDTTILRVLSRYYYWGEEVKQNKAYTYSLLKRAIALNSKESYSWIGDYLYYDGKELVRSACKSVRRPPLSEPVNSRYQEAVSYYQKGFEKGDAESTYYLAQVYDPTNYKSFDKFNNLFSNHTPKNTFVIPMEDERNNEWDCEVTPQIDYNKPEHLYLKQLREKDKPQYSDPIGQERQYRLAKAETLYKIASQKGYFLASEALAAIELSNIFEDWKKDKSSESGLDLSLALPWLVKASNQGSRKASTFLARIYLNTSIEFITAFQGRQGRLGDLFSVKQNIKTGIDYYKKAAKAGDDEAAFELAQLHEYGGVIPQNYDESLKLYQRANELQPKNTHYISAMDQLAKKMLNPENTAKQFFDQGVYEATNGRIGESILAFKNIPKGSTLYLKGQTNIAFLTKNEGKLNSEIQQSRQSIKTEVRNVEAVRQTYWTNAKFKTQKDFWGENYIEYIPPEENSYTKSHLVEFVVTNPSKAKVSATFSLKKCMALFGRFGTTCSTFRTRSITIEPFQRYVGYENITAYLDGLLSSDFHGNVTVDSVYDLIKLPEQ